MHHSYSVPTPPGHLVISLLRMLTVVILGVKMYFAVKLQWVLWFSIGQILNVMQQIIGCITLQPWNRLLRQYLKDKHNIFNVNMYLFQVKARQ
jgi:hypothetical protein